MSDFSIITNHVPRHLLFGYELTEKEASEFDYMEDVNEGSFFRYRGSVYDLGEFQRIVEPGQKSYGFEFHDLSGQFKGWHGINTDSFFSAVVVKIDDEGESVIVGTAIS